MSSSVTQPNRDELARLLEARERCARQLSISPLPTMYVGKFARTGLSPVVTRKGLALRRKRPHG